MDPSARELWQPAPTTPVACPQEVHIWLIDTAELNDGLDDCHAILAEEERARADRFVFERDRVRFILARGCLRHILACYLRISATAVRFQYNDFGKPETPGLSFNMTHSDRLALCAVTKDRRVGIDIERLRDMRAEEIAERYFTEVERQTLAALPPEHRLQAFFNGWTRKEAYLKAVGRGIGMGLDQAEVSLANTPWPEIRPRTRENWLLRSFIPAADFVAALALEGAEPAISFWIYPDPFAAIAQKAVAKATE